MKRTLRLIVNWIFILSAPLWAGWVMLVQFIYDTIRGKDYYITREIGRGEKFFWE